MVHAPMELRTAGRPQERPGLATAISEARAALGRMIVLWSNRRAVRRLATWDDRQLLDIGVTRADIYWALAQPWPVDPSLVLRTRVECRRAAARWARRFR